MEVFVVIICLFLTIVSIYFMYDVFENREYKQNVMSFKEALDLIELPVVTFYQGDKKLNFILDTGCTMNIIEEKVVKQLQSTESDVKTVMTGIGCVEQKLDTVKLKIQYKDNDFNDLFQVRDMKDTFTMIKQNYGVTLHGLIGSGFMQKYKYVLDFKEMIAYSK